MEQNKKVVCHLCKRKSFFFYLQPLQEKKLWPFWHLFRHVRKHFCVFCMISDVSLPVDQSYFHGLIVEETLGTHPILFWTICLGLVYTSTQMGTQTNHILCHKSAGMHLRQIDIEEWCFHYRWLGGWCEDLYSIWPWPVHTLPPKYVCVCVCVKSALEWCRLQKLWWIHSCARK